jgi:hypothetical protein
MAISAMHPSEFIDNKYNVLKDGKIKYTGDYNSCCTYLLSAQPFSIAFARHEGWDIVETK